MEEDLTKEAFIEVFPQFAGIPVVADAYLVEMLLIINEKIDCCFWGTLCKLGRCLLLAHYLSMFLEMLAEAEDIPETGGGTITVSDKISAEKVGDVEVKFHKPVHLLAGLSNEHNDAITQDLKQTVYGIQFMSLRRSLGALINTTGPQYL